MAFEYGGSLPPRAEVLIAAETWGCPPWEITGETDARSRARWYLFWRVFQVKRIAKAKHG